MSDSGNPEQSLTELETKLDAAVHSLNSAPIPHDSIMRVKARAIALGSKSIHGPETLTNSTATGLATSCAGQPEGQDVAFSRPTRFPSRSVLMKCLSVVSVLAVAVAMVFWPSPPDAYAGFIKQLRESRSFSYTKRIEVAGKESPIEVKIQVADDGRQRQETSGGSIMILDPSPQIRLTLVPQTKLAIVSQPHIFPADHVVKHPVDWLEFLKSHGDKPDRSLGEKMLEGRKVIGFETKQKQSTYAIWIDSQSGELVQVEHDMPIKGMSVTKVIMSNFRFSKTLDESLFSFEAPEGYRTLNSPRINVPSSTSGEASILEALRGFTKESAGRFPDSIAGLEDFVKVLSRNTVNGKLSEESKNTISHLAGVIPFLSTLDKSDYDYLGAGKTTADQRCVVFWYRSKDKKLRAIYNDFTVSDIASVP